MAYISNKLIFYNVFKFMKKNFNLKPSQEYTNISIYNISIYQEKLKYLKHYIHNCYYNCY